MENDDDLELTLVSLVVTIQGHRPVPAEDFESVGTIRFVNVLPLVGNALLSGGTLIVDEFDASIHPIALMIILLVRQFRTVLVCVLQIVQRLVHYIYCSLEAIV